MHQVHHSPLCDEASQVAPLGHSPYAHKTQGLRQKSGCPTLPAEGRVARSGNVSFVPEAVPSRQTMTILKREKGMTLTNNVI